MPGLLDQAVALHARGQLAQAEQLYRQVAAADPGNAMVLINWGHTLNGLRQFAPALEAYDRALALDPGHIFLHLVRGDVLQWLLRYDEALQSYDRFLGHAPVMPKPGTAGAWRCRAWAGWGRRFSPMPAPKPWTRRWRRHGSTAGSAIC